MSNKTPKHTDGYINSDGHLTIPFPNAAKAIQEGKEMTVWIKDKTTGKLVTKIKIPAKNP
jgi:hypothetical protein